MVQEFKRFLMDDSGPELVEWSVVTVILLIATVLILGAIGDELTNIYNQIGTFLHNDVLEPAHDPSFGG